MRIWSLAVLIFGLSVLAEAQQAPSSNPSIHDAVLEWIFAKDVPTILHHLPSSISAGLLNATDEERQEVYSGIQEKALVRPDIKLERHAGNDPFLTAEDDLGNKFAATLLNPEVDGEEARFEILVRRWDGGKEMGKWGWPKLYAVTARLEQGSWRLKRLAVVTAEENDTVDFDDPIVQYALTHGEATSEQNPAQVAIRDILKAEQTYARSFPAIGFTCTLGDLGSSDAWVQRDVHHANLLKSQTASGRVEGYNLKLQNCGNGPAHTFAVTAVPGSQAIKSGIVRTFCATQDGTIFYADNSSGEKCLSMHAK